MSATRKNKIEALQRLIKSAKEIAELNKGCNDGLVAGLGEINRSLQNRLKTLKILEKDNEAEQKQPCEGCGDGEKVPAKGYFRCPVCDTEWFDEDEDAE